MCTRPVIAAVVATVLWTVGCSNDGSGLAPDANSTNGSGGSGGAWSDARAGSGGSNADVGSGSELGSGGALASGGSGGGTGAGGVDGSTAGHDGSLDVGHDAAAADVGPSPDGSRETTLPGLDGSAPSDGGSERWVPVAAPEGASSFVAVYGDSPELVWLLSPGMVHRRTGTGWFGEPTAGMFNALSQSSRNNLWAVGMNLSMKWDGSKWETVSCPSSVGFLSGVFAMDTNDVWAVGSEGLTGTTSYIIIHWNGSSWNVSSSGGDAVLNAVWAAAANDVWAVGDYGLIMHFNGTAWSKVDAGTDASLYSVCGSSGSAVWAVGDSGTILFWNGKSWSLSPGAVGYTLRSVWAARSGEAWAVGDSGSIEHWNGTSWVKQTSGTPEPLKSVWGWGGEVWAVGDGRVILRTE